jgi:hypothetical protein
MAVSVDAYRQLLQAAEAEPPPTGASDFDALQSIEQVIAFAFRRFADEDPASACDWTEMLVRSVGLDAPTVRTIEATLRRLGFIELADRLRLIAGKRKHHLRPL